MVYMSSTDGVQGFTLKYKMFGEQQPPHRVPPKLRCGLKMAHAPSPEKASPFGEIKLIELDWASEWVHPVLPLLQHWYLLLTLPLSRATICRVGREQGHG